VLGLVGVLAIAAAAVLLTRGGGSNSPKPVAAVAATKLPANLAWQPITNLPFRRQYAASTVVGGKVWLFGGIAVKTSSTTTKSFDPASNRWSTGPGLPVPLHHFSAVTYKGEAVVIGGFIPGDELTSGQSDGVYALRNGTWERLPSLHHARAAAAAAVVGDKIVVVGGQANGKLVPQTEVFDGTRWTDKADLPTPREHLGAASDGRYLYAVGGRALSADKNSGALERYDPQDNRWTKLESMPEPNGSVGVTYAGGRIVTVGGEGTTTVSDSVFGYDIKGDKWSKLPSLATAVHGPAVTAAGTTVYAIGGATQPGHVGSTSKAEILDLSGGDASPVRVDVKWRKVANAPAKIQYAAAAEVGGRAWIFGGIGAGETPTAETAAYDRAINTWTTGPRLPKPVNHAAAVNYKGEAIVIGGFLPGDGLTSGVSDRVYGLRGDRWEELPPLNHARAAAAAAVVGDKIVVVGGQADGALVPSTEVFDGSQWTEAAPIPTPREHLGAASDGRFLYAVGGREVSAAKNVASLERYDPDNDRWTKLEPMPKAAGSVGVSFVDDRVVAVGGEGATTVSDAVQAYNVKTRKWSQLSPLPEPRHGVAVTTLAGSLYAIGGAAKAGHVDSTQDTFVLDDFG
jgi:non-specific serine/threonine protein kinase